MWYGKNLKGCSFALCCFAGNIGRAQPLLWWYKPTDPDYLVAPGLDAHDGNAPKLGSFVDVDHWVIASHPDLRGGNPVRYSDQVGSLANA